VAAPRVARPRPVIDPPWRVLAPASAPALERPAHHGPGPVASTDGRRDRPAVRAPDRAVGRVRARPRRPCDRAPSGVCAVSS